MRKENGLMKIFPLLKGISQESISNLTPLPKQKKKLR
nr:MAG TPA: hypothetical protein [Crassvirales sp.]